MPDPQKRDAFPSAQDRWRPPRPRHLVTRHARCVTNKSDDVFEIDRLIPAIRQLPGMRSDQGFYEAWLPEHPLIMGKAFSTTRKIGDGLPACCASTEPAAVEILAPSLAHPVMNEAAIGLSRDVGFLAEPVEHVTCPLPRSGDRADDL